MRKNGFVVKFQWDFPRISNSVRLVSGKSVGVLKMYSWQSGICWDNWPLKRSKLSHKLRREYCTIECWCTTLSVIQLSCNVCVCVWGGVCVCVRALLLTAVVSKVIVLLNIVSLLSKCSLPLSRLAPSFKSLASSLAHSGAPVPLPRHHLSSGFRKTVCRTRVIL